ncbi:MAG: 3-methyl-2-oxobutanoate hydroxymethyltransferase [Acidobacteria bacterium]|nr:3-methyl-2-oxobutanoate hydroxymethyltransferase [Acidobacteriota bacterium]
MEEKITAPEIARSKGQRRLAMVTASDEPSARWADRAGVDMILVGDSLAMVALGRPNTLALTMDEMVHHVRAAAAGCRRALLIADMPFGSFQISVAETVRNACRLLAEGGAEAVKIEGARLAEVTAVTAAGIPVVAHLGLTPQSLHRFGGYRVQGRDLDSARELCAAARGLTAAGAFAVVLEAIPTALGDAVTREIPVPTIGIGAGPACDGQVLVWADLLGYTDEPQPRFVRRYADLGREAQRAIAAFAADVREGRYPTVEESYPSPAGLAEALAALEEVGTC